MKINMKLRPILRTDALVDRTTPLTAAADSRTRSRTPRAARCREFRRALGEEADNRWRNQRAGEKRGPIIRVLPGLTADQGHGGFR